LVRPGEVRQRVLSDHENLRKMLETLEALCGEVLSGERRLVGPLRDRAEALLARLAEHMRWEDRHLAEALREADAWGEERADELEREHQEQRQLLRGALARLQDEGRPAPMIARELADLVHRLREDMLSEEKALLDERVLRDAVIGTDVETG
jgi:hemerythrin-like domain-containing protein